MSAPEPLRRDYALPTDCADCGQSNAGYRFRPTDDAICSGCAPQYIESDLERVGDETCHCAACEGFY